MKKIIPLSILGVSVLIIAIASLLGFNLYSKKEEPKECIFFGNVNKGELREVIIKPSNIIPIVTTYAPLERNNSIDSSELVMSNGETINPDNCGYRFIAVSPDLLKWLPFGSIVKITHTDYDGEYKVTDLMNPRWKNKIDILINRKEKHQTFRNVVIEILKVGNNKRGIKN